MDYAYGEIGDVVIMSMILSYRAYREYKGVTNASSKCKGSTRYGGVLRFGEMERFKD